jgi:hypothetical protein
MMKTSDNSVHAPLPVWKLALLLLATATLYQFVWLYRTAEDLRATRDPSILPWHWALAPLLGPFVFIPGQKLATYLKEWQTEEDKEIGHFADPVIVGMLMLVAYLPLIMLIVDWSILPVLLLICWLMLCLSYLILQGQLNRNTIMTADRSFRSASWRFEKYQLWAAGLGCVVAVPLYITMFTNLQENWFAADLVEGTTINSETGHFQVRILDDGWSQVGEQYMNDDSDLEFYGPTDWAWAVVYDSPGESVDGLLAYRQEAIREDYTRAQCEQHKTLSEVDWTVRGSLVCSGRSPLEGDYIFASRILRQGQNVVEILAYVSESNPQQFENLSARMLKFTEGLELTP